MDYCLWLVSLIKVGLFYNIVCLFALLFLLGVCAWVWFHPSAQSLGEKRQKNLIMKLKEIDSIDSKKSKDSLLKKQMSRDRYRSKNG